MVERVQPCRGDDPRLPHRAAEEVLLAPGELHRLRRPREQRPQRAAEPLREAERRRVGPSPDLGRVDALCDGGVEHPRAVEMDADVERARADRERRRARRAASSDRRAALLVFSTETTVTRWSAAFPVGAAMRSRSSAAEAARLGGDADRDQPGMNRRAPVLVDEDVGVLVRDEDVAGAGVQLERDLVRHRRRRHEQRGLVTEESRDPLLQLGDGRVLAALLVAHLRGGDRRAHARGWAASPCPSGGRSRREPNHARPSSVVGPSRGPPRSAPIGSDVPARGTLVAWTSTSSSRRLRESGAARLPRAPGLGVGRARLRGLRGDDEPAEALRETLAAEVPFSTLAVVEEHHAKDGTAEDPVPHLRRPPGRGGADALQGRTTLGVRLEPVRLSAHLHVLRDRPDGVRPEPHAMGDPRPGPALPAHGDAQPPRVHGDGRAVHERRQRARRGAPTPRPRDHAASHDDLDRRLGAGA